MSAILTNQSATQILEMDSKTVTVTAASSNFNTSWNAFTPPSGQFYGTFAGPGTLTATDSALTFVAHTYGYVQFFITTVSGSDRRPAHPRIGRADRDRRRLSNSGGFARRTARRDRVSFAVSDAHLHERAAVLLELMHAHVIERSIQRYLPARRRHGNQRVQFDQAMAREQPRCLSAPKGSPSCGRSS